MNTENYTENCLKLLKQLISIPIVNPSGKGQAQKERVYKNEAK